MKKTTVRTGAVTGMTAVEAQIHGRATGSGERLKISQAGRAYAQTAGLIEQAVLAATAGVDDSEQRLRGIELELRPASAWSESMWDLPLAVAALQLVGHTGTTGDALIIGALGKGESIAGTSCVTPVARLAQELQRRLIVPSANGAEAIASGATDVQTCARLSDIGAAVTGARKVQAQWDADWFGARQPAELGDVEIDGKALEALEVAAAAKLNLLLLESRRSGATALLRRLPAILPRMDPWTALETNTIHSVAGLMGHGWHLVQPPLRAPHYSVSAKGISGSCYGKRPIPGEASKAHGGALCLIEIDQFAVDCLDAVRTAQAARETRIGENVYPARFLLAATALTTRRGSAEHQSKGAQQTARALERSALAGRFDLIVTVDPAGTPTRGAVAYDAKHWTTAATAQRVAEAYHRRATRKGEPPSTDAAARVELARIEAAVGRGVAQTTLRIAETIRDLRRGEEAITPADIKQAAELQGPGITSAER